MKHLLPPPHSYAFARRMEASGRAWTVALLGVVLASAGLDSTFAQQASQEVELAAGWNLISLNVLPESSSGQAFDAILADVASVVRVAKDVDGRRYEPAAGIDELSPWNPDQAYYLWAEEAARFNVRGAPVAAPSIRVELQKGWNWMPYPLTEPSPIDEVLGEVLEDVHLVKDGRGNVYVPSNGIDGIGSVRPGQGYEVRMHKAHSVTFTGETVPTHPGDFRYAAGCLSHPGHVLVEDYGVLTPGAAADSLQRVANAAAINKAIRAAPAGGAVCLPADSLYLAWDREPDVNYGHVAVSRDEVTIWGAGACGWGDLPGCTYIGTPGDDLYSLKDRGNELLVLSRGNGLEITAPRPRGGGTLRDITLRGFELDGQLGWTGCYSYSYKRNYWVNKDCWDLTHKGIHIGADKNVDNVLIEDVKVHGYRGEVMYAGGYGFGDVTVRRVWSYGSNGSANNFATAQNLLIEDSRFGYPGSDNPEDRVRFWHEFLAEHLDGLRATIRNNEYAGCQIGSGCIAFAFDKAGHRASNQRWVFEENTVDCEAKNGDNLPAFQVEAGPYALTIRENTFDQCSLGFFNGGPGDYPVDLLVEQNTLDQSEGGQAIVFQGDGRYRGAIRGNTFRGRSGLRAYSASGGNLHGLVIEGNTFAKFATPTFSGNGPISAPLWGSNTYDGFAHVRQNYFASTDPIIEPTYDIYRLRASGEDRTLRMSGRHADGQRVELRVDGGSNRVRLPAGRAHHGWSSPIVLRAGDRLWLVFDRDTKKWSVDGSENVASGG